MYPFIDNIKNDINQAPATTPAAQSPNGGVVSKPVTTIPLNGDASNDTTLNNASTVSLFDAKAQTSLKTSESQEKPNQIVYNNQHKPVEKNDSKTIFKNSQAHQSQSEKSPDKFKSFFITLHQKAAKERAKIESDIKATNAKVAKDLHVFNSKVSNDIKATNAKISKDVSNFNAKVKTDLTNAHNEVKGYADKVLSKFYTRYKTASIEDKKKYAARYIQQFKSANKQAQVFHKMYQGGNSVEEKQVLASTASKLHVVNQIKAAKEVCNTGSDVQMKAARTEVASTLHHFNRVNQKGVAEVIVATNDKDAIKLGASHAAECDKSAQVDVVKTFQKIDNKDVNKILIDQYGKYDVKNQLEIHKTMSSSKNSETVEYAAANIYLFNKVNQLGALKLTRATGNLRAIQAAASQLGKLDKSVQKAADEIIKQAEAEEKKEANVQKEDDQKNSSETQAIQANIPETAAISASPSTDAEKISMMGQMNQNDLINHLGSIMGQNASPELINKAISMLGSNISGQDAERVLGLVQNSTYAQNVILTQLGSINPSAQIFVVKTAAESGTLNKIDRDLLSQSAKIEFDKLVNETKQKQGNSGI